LTPVFAPRHCGLATSRRPGCHDAQGSSTTGHKAAAAAAATGQAPKVGGAGSLEMEFSWEWVKQLWPPKQLSGGWDY